MFSPNDVSVTEKMGSMQGFNVKRARHEGYSYVSWDILAKYKYV